jgi:hypothetical protein
MNLECNHKKENIFKDRKKTYYLLEIRIQRLLEEYKLSAPEAIIEKEYELIKKAVKKLAKLEGSDVVHKIKIISEKN